MNKAFARFRRNKKADPYEKAAESIFLSYYCLIIVGENFSLVSGDQVLSDAVAQCSAYRDANLTAKDLNNPKWIKNDEELFYGVWGSILNRFQRMRTNECYPIMLTWRKSMFWDDDERFKEEKKKNDKEEEKAKPVAKKKENRFFYLTSNIDGEVEKVGFAMPEVLETRGNIINWQCSVPCNKTFWRIEDEFRFEILDNGRAPPIKYVEHVSTTNRDKKKKESSYVSDIPTDGVGDEEEFNFYDPHGRFHHDQVKGMYNEFTSTPRAGYNSRHVTTPRTGRSIVKKSDKFLSLNLAEKRGLNFRYFGSSTADQLKNPEYYYRPGTRQTLNSIHSSSGVLYPLKDIHTLSSTRGNAKPASILRHECFPADEDQITHHTDLHNIAFNGLVDSREEGLMEVLVVDPLIHHTQFYTTTTGTTEEMLILQKERLDYMEKLRNQTPTREDLLDDVLVPGSDTTFCISLQVKDDENMAVVKYLYENVKPKIRKKRERDGLFVDSIIINVQEEQAKKNEGDHTLPSKGYISLVVEPCRLKTQDSTTKRELSNQDDKPWQICGEYMVEGVKVGVDLGDHEAQPPTKVVDFIMYARDSIHRLRIRTIQHEVDNNRIEIVSIFIDIPISNFKRTPGPSPHHKEPQTPSSPNKRGFPSASASMEKESIEAALKYKESRIPVMNRQFCESCRGLARPHVKMLEDKTFIPATTKAFRAWCMEVKKTMSQDPSKKLVIVEFGAEAGLRKQSDLFLKQTAAYGSCMVRINPSAGAKKGKDTSMAPKGLQNEEAFQLVEDESCLSAIQKIDAALRTICDKFKFPIEDVK